MEERNYTKRKGYAVEETVSDALHNMEGCYVIGNTEISFNGEFAQIDNIVISPRAIYVIEVKSVRYSITGNTFDRKWLFCSNKKSGILKDNPLVQNQKHIRVLEKLLLTKINKLPPIINIVCVGGNDRARIKSDNNNVCKVSTLKYNLMKDILNPTIDAYKCYKAVVTILNSNKGVSYGK